MNLQILVATMNDKFMLRKDIVLDKKYLIINQVNDNYKSNYKASNIFSINEKGLAKSRNRAIENCTSDIALISDDDLEYVDDIKKIITEAHQKHKDADVITFQVQTPEGKPYKKYSEKSFWHNHKTLMGISSVEISFKTKSIKDKNLKFDERFGLGSTYPTSEETIFLTDALKKGLKILYLPIPIVIHPPVSSGGNFKNLKLIEAKGAMIQRIFGNWSYLLSLYFSFRKYRVSNLSFLDFYFTMLRGIKKLKSEKDL